MENNKESKSLSRLSEKHIKFFKRWRKNKQENSKKIARQKDANFDE